MGIAAPREADVQRACRQWLALWGAVAIRVNSGALKVGTRYVAFNSEPGCGDVLACLPGGRFASIEFKRPGRDRTAAARRAAQLAHRTAVARAGGLALVVTSLTDLASQLETLGYDTTIRA
jgi:hypothetical protein